MFRVRRSSLFVAVVTSIVTAAIFAVMQLALAEPNTAGAEMTKPVSIESFYTKNNAFTCAGPGSCNGKPTMVTCNHPEVSRLMLAAPHSTPSAF